MAPSGGMKHMQPNFATTYLNDAIKAGEHVFSLPALPETARSWKPDPVPLNTKSATRSSDPTFSSRIAQTHRPRLNQPSVGRSNGQQSSKSLPNAPPMHRREISANLLREQTLRRLEMANNLLEVPENPWPQNSLPNLSQSATCHAEALRYAVKLNTEKSMMKDEPSDRPWHAKSKAGAVRKLEPLAESAGKPALPTPETTVSSSGVELLTFPVVGKTFKSLGPDRNSCLLSEEKHTEPPGAVSRSRSSQHSSPKKESLSGPESINRPSPRDHSTNPHSVGRTSRLHQTNNPDPHLSLAPERSNGQREGVGSSKGCSPSKSRKVSEHRPENTSREKITTSVPVCDTPRRDSKHSRDPTDGNKLSENPTARRIHSDDLTNTKASSCGKVSCSRLEAETGEDGTVKPPEKPTRSAATGVPLLPLSQHQSSSIDNQGDVSSGSSPQRAVPIRGLDAEIQALRVAFQEEKSGIESSSSGSASSESLSWQAMEALCERTHECGGRLVQKYCAEGLDTLMTEMWQQFSQLQADRLDRKEKEVKQQQEQIIKLLESQKQLNKSLEHREHEQREKIMISVVLQHKEEISRLKSMLTHLQGPRNGQTVTEAYLREENAQLTSKLERLQRQLNEVQVQNMIVMNPAAKSKAKRLSVQEGLLKQFDSINDLGNIGPWNI